jgi:hypothetical protein
MNSTRGSFWQPPSAWSLNRLCVSKICQHCLRRLRPRRCTRRRIIAVHEREVPNLVHDTRLAETSQFVCGYHARASEAAAPPRGRVSFAIADALTGLTKGGSYYSHLMQRCASRRYGASTICQKPRRGRYNRRRLHEFCGLSGCRWFVRLLGHE